MDVKVTPLRNIEKLVLCCAVFGETKRACCPTSLHRKRTDPAVTMTIKGMLILLILWIAHNERVYCSVMGKAEIFVTVFFLCVLLNITLFVYVRSSLAFHHFLFVFFGTPLARAIVPSSV